MNKTNITKHFTINYYYELPDEILNIINQYKKIYDMHVNICKEINQYFYHTPRNIFCNHYYNYVVYNHPGKLECIHRSWTPVEHKNHYYSLKYLSKLRYLSKTKTWFDEDNNFELEQPSWKLTNGRLYNNFNLSLLPWCYKYLGVCNTFKDKYYILPDIGLSQWVIEDYCKHYIDNNDINITYDLDDGYAPTWQEARNNGYLHNPIYISICSATACVQHNNICKNMIW
jgi:hypothetical protein